MVTLDKGCHTNPSSPKLAAERWTWTPSCSSCQSSTDAPASARGLHVVEALSLSWKQNEINSPHSLLLDWKGELCLPALDEIFEAFAPLDAALGFVL